MKISQGFGVLTICFAVITLCVAGRRGDRPTVRPPKQQQTTQRHNARASHDHDDDYHYDDDYDDDYHEQYEIPEPVVMINCYSCHYQNERGYAQGSVNCQEPFAPEQIAVIKCAGPCAKIYRTLDAPGEFMISRNCVPKCKDIRSEKGYTDCCSNHLCNGANGAGRYRRRTIAHVAVILLFCSLVLTLT